MNNKFERVLLVDDNDIDNFINERMITILVFQAGDSKKFSRRSARFPAEEF